MAYNYMKFSEEIKKEKRLSSNNRTEIFGVEVDLITSEETVQVVKKYIEANEPLHLMGVNADKINEAQNNPKLKEIINSCGVVNADGASVVWAGKKLGIKIPERVSGIDLMQDLVRMCSEHRYGVYLLGAKQEVVEKTRDVLLEKNPSLNIVGIKDGYFSDSEWDSIVKDLKKKEPKIVFVGITSPKKEYLIEYLQNRGVKAVFMGVGGSFDVLSGDIARAPKWMQRIGLEWFFRLLQEPRRLFKRYLVGNIAFIDMVNRKKREGRRK